VNSGQYPLVVSTWPFLEAVRAGWRAVDSGLSAVDSVVEGCSACEELRCDGTGGKMSLYFVKFTEDSVINKLIFSDNIVLLHVWFFIMYKNMNCSFSFACT
jgi:hypothetical protein